MEHPMTALREKGLVDDRGFLLPHPCKVCGKMMDDTWGKPAELYLGTYTGMCYECQRKGPYYTQEYPLDGALTISYPPSSPSWRRDRQEFTTYLDCPECHGTGMKSRYNNSTWSYVRDYCKPCLDRWSDHPSRQLYRRLWELVYKGSQNRYNLRLRVAAKTPKKLKGEKAVKHIKDTLCPEEIEAIRVVCKAAFDHAAKRLESSALARKVGPVPCHREICP